MSVSAARPSKFARPKLAWKARCGRGHTQNRPLNLLQIANWSAYVFKVFLLAGIRLRGNCRIDLKGLLVSTAAANRTRRNRPQGPIGVAVLLHGDAHELQRLPRTVGDGELPVPVELRLLQVLVVHRCHVYGARAGLHSDSRT